MAREKSRKRRAVKRQGESGPLIQCVIFDLDDTLYDCLGQRVFASHRFAAEAMVRAGLKAEVGAVYRARIRAFRQDPMLRYIDAEVCRKFGLEEFEVVSRAAREAYFHCPVGELNLFRGTLPLLRFLHQQRVSSYIVSFGEPAVQQAKVRALGLDREQAIRGIFYADRSQILTKEAAFRQIQTQTGFESSSILVVGDRPMSEIRAGNMLGMYTVRIHRGEFFSQAPASREEEAHYVIRSISELRKLPFRFGGGSRQPAQTC